MASKSVRQHVTFPSMRAQNNIKRLYRSEPMTEADRDVIEAERQVGNMAETLRCSGEIGVTMLCRTKPE